MATVEPPPPGYTNRALIAYDSRIFTFQTDPNDRVASKVHLVYVPKPEEKSSICVRFHGKEVTDYLALEDASNGMFTTLKPVRYLNGKLLKFDSSKFHSLYQHRAKEFTTRSDISVEGFSTKIEREDISYSSNDKDWKLCLSNFKGFPPNIEVEYAPTRKFYIQRCSTYGILKENCPKLIVHEQKERETKRKLQLRELRDGLLDDIPVVVKRTNSKSVTSHYVISTMIQRLANEHKNLVRVYDSGCHGQNYCIAMEECKFDLANAPPNMEKSQKIEMLRELSTAIAYLHERNIVHGRIRPSHVLLNFDGDSVIPKLCGMGSCKISPRSFADCFLHKDPGLFAKDVFDFARTAFNCLGDGSHQFPDSDKESDTKYQNKEQFQEEMDAFMKRDPVSHDFVKRLLTCPWNFISSKDIGTHFIFWVEGRYLEFLMKVADLTTGRLGDKQLKQNINSNSQKVIGESWESSVDGEWVRQMTTTRKRKIGDDVEEETSTYDFSKVTDLLRLARDTVHHIGMLSKGTLKNIGGTYNGFEKYITTLFPQLFMTVYNTTEETVQPISLELKEYYDSPFRKMIVR